MTTAVVGVVVSYVDAPPRPRSSRVGRMVGRTINESE